MPCFDTRQDKAGFNDEGLGILLLQFSKVNVVKNILTLTINLFWHVWRKQKYLKNVSITLNLCRKSNLNLMKNHHHHVVSPAWISLTLSRQSSLSLIATGRSSVRHPLSSQSNCIYARAGCPAFARPYEGSIGEHHLSARLYFYSSVLHVWFV